VSLNRKQELSKVVQDNKGSLLGESILGLLDILLQEAREKNDDSKGEEYLRIQGEIASYKAIIAIFTRKPSPTAN
jgi:hypothetical protein